MVIGDDGVPHDPAMNAVAGLVARLIDVPMAVVTLVRNEHEYVLGAHGLPARPDGAGHVPIAGLVGVDRAVWCGDMSGDENPRVRAHPLVVGHGVRAFLGCRCATARHPGRRSRPEPRARHRAPARRHHHSQRPLAVRHHGSRATPATPPAAPSLTGTFTATDRLARVQALLRARAT